MEDPEIIIIGAGAAGLATARQLSTAGRKVMILEARRRLGGRIHTFKDKKFTTWTEAGAEFVHGKLETTLDLLNEYGIEYNPTEGQIWHFRHGKPEKDKDYVPEHHHLLKKKLNSLKRDMPLKKFLDLHFKGVEYDSLREGVTSFVQGYESGDVERFSTKAFRDDWLDAEDWKHYRIENGYSALIKALAEDCRQHGSKIRLSCEVKRIKWKKNLLEVICTNGKRFTAQQAVIAVQLSNLQQNKILFSPALHEKAKAVRELGFGDVIKVQLLFKTKFWEEKRLQERVGKNLDKLFFLFSQEAIPTWWTQYPSSSTLLTGWLSGPAAKKLSTKTNREIVEAARNSLASIFNTNKKTISSKLKSWKVINWSKDEYTRGSYSYATVNAKKYRNIAGRPEKKTLFFAGEYLDESPGTVEAALKSGFKTASDILS